MAIRKDQEVRLRVYSIGTKGGRKLEASRIVQHQYAHEERMKWARELGNGYEVTTQTASASGGPIRPRV